MTPLLCLDFGSTFTKGVLIDPATGEPVARASHPTTIATDVLDGARAICAELGCEPDFTAPTTYACSSAGGGLRLAVVGFERQVTAEAGFRVGLSAGAKVVHVSSGPMTPESVAVMAETRPDVILLVGGTDGGNAEVLLHNAQQLADARVAVPVVVAGNVRARDEVVAALAAAGVPHVAAENVLPRIGVIAPESARAAIREVFLSHVIGGKGLSEGPTFAQMVRAATPDAMLTGIEVMAEATDGDVMVVDIGGATTDVYSVLGPPKEDGRPKLAEVAGELASMRTVEGDLGMRWNAPNIVEAAQAERIPLQVAAAELAAWAASVHEVTDRLPADEREQALDMELARLAALVAVRRHARPYEPGAEPRHLIDLAHVVGSGGVLRHTPRDPARAVLSAVTRDHAGGWKVPEGAELSIDDEYLLFAAGLVAADRPDVAARIARRVRL